MNLNFFQQSAKLFQVLGIIVNLVTDGGKITTEYLEGVPLVTVNSENVTNAILGVLSSRDIPFSNLVSILMDSCNVMRG